MMGYYDGYGMGYFGGTFMILFWGAIIWLIVWLINQNKQPGHKYDERRTPQEILKERFAKGEITKKEYSEMKNELTN